MDVNIINDVNHKLKNFHTSFKNISKKHNICLRVFEKQLKKWLGHVLFSDNSPEIKIKMWENTTFHRKPYFLQSSYQNWVYYSYLKHNKPDECFMLIRNKNKVQVNDIDRNCIKETLNILITESKL